MTQVKGAFDQELLLNAPPNRRSVADLEVFTPFNKDVYFDNPVFLKGRSAVSPVLVTIGSGEDKVLPTDETGRFETPLSLTEGVSQISVLMIKDGKELVKELVVGNYPKGDESDDYMAILGEIKIISSDKISVFLELVNQKDSLNILVDKETDIFKTNELGQEQAIPFNQLEIGQRVGVIAYRTSDGDFFAEQIRVSLYPYNFWGNVVEKEEEVIVVERRRLGGPQSKVVIQENTQVVKWSKDGDLKPTDPGEIALGDRVYVNGFVRPKENRTTFFANRILVLK